MAKRWTETNKWKDKWYMSLTPNQKLIWEYLRDNCDNAGFFEINSRVDSFMIGISEADYLGAYEGLMRGYLKSKDLTRIWLRKFLFHQKNVPLNPANNAHKQIIGIINENLSNFEYDFTYLGAYEGLFSPIGKGKGNDIGNNGGQGGNLVYSEKEIKVFFEQSQQWAESVCMNKKITPTRLKYFQIEFLKEVKDSTQLYPNQQEAIKHFNNWLKKQLNPGGKIDPASQEVGRKDYTEKF